MKNNGNLRQAKKFLISEHTVCDFLLTVIIIFVTVAVSGMLTRWTNSSANVTALFILAVLLVARFTEGYVWGIIASVMGVFAINFAFTYPFYQINFTVSGYPIIFLSLLLTSVITSALTGSSKQQTRRARASELRTRNLYEFSQRLASASDMDSMIDLTLRYLQEFLDRPVMYLRSEDSMIQNEERVCGTINCFVSDSIENSAIKECFKEKNDTGAGTRYVPYATFRYIPLVSGASVLGCYGIQWKDDPADEDTIEHVRAILAQAGVSLELRMLTEERNNAAMAADREKMRGDLLRCISHDLRTPLTGIIGASAAIYENMDQIGLAETKRLAQDIREDAQWLLRMVENLLSVTRVAQTTTLKKSEEAAEEVIAEAVLRCKKRYPDAQIRIRLPDEMLFVPMDVTLIIQVLINLLENAVRYAETPIDISMKRNGAYAEFSVRDFGPGIAADKRKTLFETTQGQSDSRRGGLGIGLTLCKSIIAAHNGTIYEENHPDGGAQFVFILPLEEEK